MSKTFDYFLQGWGLYMRFTAQANAEARIAYQKAIDADVDGEFYRAHADLAYSILHAWFFNWDTKVTLQNAKDALQKTPAKYHTDFYYLWIKAALHLYSREFDDARTEYQNSWNAAQKDAISEDLEALRVDRAEMLLLTGKAKDAIADIAQAIKATPVPEKWFYWVQSWAYYEDGQWQQALDAMTKNIGNTRNGMRKNVIASLVTLNRVPDAVEEAKRFLLEEKSQGTTYAPPGQPVLAEILKQEEKIPFENLARRTHWQSQLQQAFDGLLQP